MSKAAAMVIVLVVVFNCISSPVDANWFGKRGKKDSLYSILIQHPRLGTSRLDRSQLETSQLHRSTQVQDDDTDSEQIAIDDLETTAADRWADEDQGRLM